MLFKASKKLKIYEHGSTLYWKVRNLIGVHNVFYDTIKFNYIMQLICNVGVSFKETMKNLGVPFVSTLRYTCENLFIATRTNILNCLALKVTNGLNEMGWKPKMQLVLSVPCCLQLKGIRCFRRGHVIHICSLLYSLCYKAGLAPSLCMESLCR